MPSPACLRRARLETTAVRIARNEPGSQTASIRRCASSPRSAAAGAPVARGSSVAVLIAAPSMQITALWPPKPNELEIARGGRPVPARARGSDEM